MEDNEIDFAGTEPYPSDHELVEDHEVFAGDDADDSFLDEDEDDDDFGADEDDE